MPEKSVSLAAPPAPVSPAVHELLQKQRSFRAEIEDLERQIEPLYDAIARGAAGVPSSFRGVELEEMVERSRHMRDDLQAKRVELVRIERMLARERRLQPAIALGGDASSSRETARTRTQANPPQPRPAGAAQQERDVAAARQRFSSPIRSQYLVFEKAAQALFDEDANVRRHAAIQLAELPSAGSQDLLVRALEDPVERVRVAALNALGNHATPPEIFQRFLRDKSPHLRLASLRGLAKRESGTGDAALIAALDDEDPSVRKSVATLLGWRESKPAVRPLSRALRDEDPSVRQAVAEALAQIRSDKAVLSLMRALDDEAAAVRDAAERALRSIAGDEIAKISEGLGGEQRQSALKQWWKESRVAILVAQQNQPRREVSAESATRLAETDVAVSPPRVSESIRETAQAARAAALRIAEKTSSVRATSVKAKAPAESHIERAAEKVAAERTGPAGAKPAEKAAAVQTAGGKGKGPASAHVEPAASRKPAAEPAGLAGQPPDLEGVAARVADAPSAPAGEVPTEGTKDAGNEEFESLFADTEGEAQPEKQQEDKESEEKEEGAVSAKDLL